MHSDNPLVSFIIIAYKHEQFIREALISALAQTYNPLEIIISDDCSPDNTYEIIKSEISKYKGPHTVKINRNEKNLGLADNLNRAFQLASGQYFIMAASDDISLPERTTLLVERLKNTNTPVDLICSYFEEIDLNSNSTGYIKTNVLFLPDTKLPVYRWACGASGACASYSRKLYDKYGPIDSRIIAEDWVLSFRAWMESGLALVEKPLVKHRTHDSNLSKLHENINSIKNSETRRSLRKKNLAGELAMAKEWLHAYQVSGKINNESIQNELEEWIQLLAIERKAYETNRVGALKLALLAITHKRGFRSAIKIIIRNIIKIN